MHSPNSDSVPGWNTTVMVETVTVKRGQVEKFRPPERSWSQSNKIRHNKCNGEQKKRFTGCTNV